MKRRGRHMLVSPLDWSLMEMWKQRGIPLHIVLRGINSSFDGYDERARRGRKVNSLFYCQQEVESQFLEYCDSQVGGAQNGQAHTNGNGHAPEGYEDASPVLSRQAVTDHLSERLETLKLLGTRHADNEALKETFERVTMRLEQIIEDLQVASALMPESLETDLTMIEEVILDGLKDGLGQEPLKEIENEGHEKLRGYKKSMGQEVYRQTINNFIARQLREQFKIPRLSLFYL